MIKKDWNIIEFEMSHECELCGEEECEEIYKFRGKTQISRACDPYSVTQTKKFEISETKSSTLYFSKLSAI